MSSRYRDLSELDAQNYLNNIANSSNPNQGGALANKEAEQMLEDRKKKQVAQEVNTTRALADRGAETEVNIQTGKRELSRHPDGAVKFTPKLDEVKPVQTVTATPQGQTPNADIMLGGGGGADSASVGLGKQTETQYGQTGIDDRGNPIVVPTKPEVDPKTGFNYVEMKDPVTGETKKVRQSINIKETEKLGRKMMLDDEAAQLDMRENAIKQQKLVITPMWEPVKKEYDEANEQVAKLPSDLQKRGEQWVKVNPETGEETLATPFEVARRKTLQDQAYSRANTAAQAYSKLSPRVTALEQAEQEAAAKKLEIEQRKIRLDNDLPEDDGEVSAVLAWQSHLEKQGIDGKDITGTTPERYKDVIEHIRAGGQMLQDGTMVGGTLGDPNAPMMRTEDRPDEEEIEGAAIIPNENFAQPKPLLTPESDQEAIKSAFGALRGIENLNVETTAIKGKHGGESQLHKLTRDGVPIAYVTNGGFAPVVELTKQGRTQGDVLEMINTGATQGIPLYMQSNPNRKKLTDEAAEVAGVFQLVKNPEFYDANGKATPKLGEELKRMRATPQEIMQRVDQGELSVQHGQAILKEVFGTTMEASNPKDPKEFAKWVAESTAKANKELQAKYGKENLRASNTPAERVKNFNTGLTPNYADRDNLQKDFLVDKYIENAGKPGVRRSDYVRMHNEVNSGANAGIIDKGAAFAGFLGKTGKEVVGSMIGLAAGALTQTGAGIVSFTGDEKAQATFDEFMKIRNLSTEQFVLGLERNRQVWFTSRGKKAMGELDFATKNFQQTIDREMDKPEADRDQAAIQAAKQQIIKGALALHALNDDGQNPITADNVDPDKDPALMASLGRYVKTADPRMFEEFKARLLSNNLGRELAVEMDKKVRQDGFFGAIEGGMYAGWQELGTELLADASMLVTAGGSKGLQNALRFAGATNKAMKVERAVAAVGSAIDKLNDIGIKAESLINPLTRVDKARNAVVGGAKTLVQAGVGEAAEEMIVEAGSDDPNLVQAGLVGAIGGVILTPAFYPMQRSIQNGQVKDAERALQIENRKFAQSYNERNADVPGFEPITHEVAGAARQLLNVSNYEQRMGEAVKRIQTATTPEEALAAMKEVEALAPMSERAIDAAREIAAMPDPTQRVFYSGIAKVAAGNAASLTTAERAAVQQAQTDQGTPYFANVNGKEVITDEARAEIAMNAPIVGSIIETTESAAIAAAQFQQQAQQSNEQNTQGQPGQEAAPQAAPTQAATPQDQPVGGGGGTAGAGQTQGQTQAPAITEMEAAEYAAAQQTDPSLPSMEQAVTSAFSQGKPVSVSMATQADISPPSGYVRQGSRFVSVDSPAAANQATATNPQAGAEISVNPAVDKTNGQNLGQNSPARQTAERVKAAVEARFPSMKGRINIVEELMSDGNGGVRRSGGVYADDKNGISLSLPDIEREMQGVDPAAYDAILTDMVIRHEIVHVIQYQAVRAMQKAQGGKASFETFFRDFYGKMATEFAPEVFAAARKIYGANSWDAIPEDALKAAEVVRMLVEAKLNPGQADKFSELSRAIELQVSPSLIELMKTAVDMLIEMVKTGALPESARKHIDEVAAMYQALSTSTAEQAAVPTGSLPDGQSPTSRDVGEPAGLRIEPTGDTAKILNGDTVLWQGKADQVEAQLQLMQNAQGSAMQITGQALMRAFEKNPQITSKQKEQLYDLVDELEQSLEGLTPEEMGKEVERSIAEWLDSQEAAKAEGEREKAQSKGRNIDTPARRKAKKLVNSGQFPAITAILDSGMKIAPRPNRIALIISRKRQGKRLTNEEIRLLNNDQDYNGALTQSMFDRSGDGAIAREVVSMIMARQGEGITPDEMAGYYRDGATSSELWEQLDKEVTAISRGKTAMEGDALDPNRDHTDDDIERELAERKARGEWVGDEEAPLPSLSEIASQMDEAYGENTDLAAKLRIIEPMLESFPEPQRMAIQQAAVEEQQRIEAGVISAVKWQEMNPELGPFASWFQRLLDNHSRESMQNAMNRLRSPKVQEQLSNMTLGSSPNQRSLDFGVTGDLGTRNQLGFDFSDGPRAKVKEKAQAAFDKLPEDSPGRARIAGDIARREGLADPQVFVDAATAKPEAAQTVDEKANEAATSPENATPQPTEAQKKAGNYKVGRVSIGGMDISIENPAGSTRGGVSDQGKRWEVTMESHYGYIRGTEGKDGDHIDIFIEQGTPENYAGPVFVVNQLNAEGNFDEHKAVLGPNITTEDQAKAEYLKNYSPGWNGAGSIAKFDTVEAFRKWATERKRIAPAKTDSLTLQPEGSTNEITDFGEKIGGARKDYAQTFADAKQLDIASEPFSKVWPEPNYKKLIADGIDPYVVGFIRSMRDEVPVKPRRWGMSTYIQQVETLRGLAESLVSGEISQDTFREMLRSPKYENLNNAVGGRAELYQMMGHDQSFKGFRFQHTFYNLYKGEPNVWKWEITKPAKATAFGNMPMTLAEGNSREEVLAKFKALVAGKDLSAKPKIKFDIYRYNNKAVFHIGKKIGRHTADLFTFETAKEARDYLRENYDDVVARLESYKKIGEERRAENAPRIGADHLKGRDITPAMFQDAFGFRGVEFGNYVEQKRRQSDLNRAYEALMDLSGILNISPKTLSLDGTLGLAFGARGSGGKNAAAAHYESGKVVINLTKNNGPGSLAHEWFHAMDNYFLRQVGKPMEFATAKRGTGWGGRLEVMEAFGNIIKTIDQTGLRKRSMKLDKKRTNPYWSTDIELSARAFENYVIARMQAEKSSNDYLVNIADISAYAESMIEAMFEGNTAQDLYPYLTEEEIGPVVEAFDNLFSKIQTKPTEKGIALFSSPGIPRGEQQDLFTAVSRPEAKEVLGDVKAGRAHALNAYRALTAKRATGKALSASEEQQLLDAETALGQKLAFDMEELRKESDPEPTPPQQSTSLPRADQQDMMLGGETLKGGQITLFSSPASFYSPLQRAIDAKIPARATPEQIMATVRATNVKEEEIKWSGIEQALSSLAVDGKVPKDALLAYLADEGAVKLEDITLGAIDKQKEAAAQEKYRIAHQKLHREAFKQGIPNAITLAYDAANGKLSNEYLESLPSSLRKAAIEIKEAQDERESLKETATKYAQYQLPGGENYREVVLAMPVNIDVYERKIREMTEDQLSDEMWRVAGLRPEKGLKREDHIQFILMHGGIGIKERSPLQYTSRHFPDIPNYVAHMRLNERMDANGNKGLFIEEIQSDRHQEGRKKGYKSDEITARLEGDNYIVTTPTEERKLNAMNFNNEQEAVDFIRRQTIADAPFRTTWPLQMFKRALRDAVASGKDWIGWTTGETQNERYDLSKQVQELKLFNHGNGNWDISAIQKGGGLVDLASRIPESKLVDYIGKDMAAKAIETQKEKGWHNYSGIDLKVGGKGMTGFYDTMLPKEIGKYVKQWGAKVEKSTIGQSISMDDLDMGELDDATPEELAQLEANGNAKGDAVPIWRVNITPEMANSIQSEGLALFSSPSGIRPANTLDEAKEAAKSFIATPIKNSDDGLVATVSKNALLKMTSESAVNKSASLSAHAHAVANLDNLFEDAIRTHSGPDENSDPNIAAMHRYYAPFQIGDQMLVAKMTVKEFARQSEGSRIYTVESMDIVKPAGNWAASISEDRRNYAPQAGFEEKLQSKIDKIKENSLSQGNESSDGLGGQRTGQSLGSSPSQDADYMKAVEAGDMETAQRMVDNAAESAGYRQVVSHQTNKAGIEVFDRHKGGKGVYEWDNIGIWTTGRSTPKLYGSVNMPLYGSMQNPKRYKDLDAYEKMVREYLSVAYPEVMWELRADEVASDQFVDKFKQAIKKLAKKAKVGESSYTQRYQQWLTSKFPGAQGFRNYLKEQGYDGIQVDGAYWDGEIQTVRIFLDANQLKSAEPVTRDSEGNVIPLSQRFNSQSNSILFSSPSTEPSSEAVQEALAKMPPIYRKVFEAVNDGDSPAMIAEKFNLTDRAVTNILNQVNSRITAATKAADSDLAPKMREGKIDGGRPDLALGGNKAVAAIDQVRNESGVPDVRGWSEVFAEAEKRLNNDYQATYDEMLEKARNLQPMTDVEVAITKRIIARETMEGRITTPEERVKMAMLIHGYRDIGTETARSLAIRRDPDMKPAERHAQFIAEALFSPDPKTRARLRKSSPKDQQSILAGWMSRVDKIKAELKARGIDLDASLAAFNARKQEMEAAAQLSPRTTEIIEDSIRKLTKREKTIVEALRPGQTTYEGAAYLTGVTKEEAKAIYSAWVSGIKTAMKESAQRYLTATLGSSPSNVMSNILDELGVVDPDLIAMDEADRPRVEAEKAKREPQKARKPRKRKEKSADEPGVEAVLPKGTKVTPELEAKWAEAAERFRNAPPSTWKTLWQIEMENLGPMFGTIPFGKVEQVFGPAWKAEQIEMFPEPRKPINETTGTFDLNDLIAMKEVIQAFSVARHGFGDKLMEYWRMSILTGPHTHIVNTGSNLMHAAYRLIPRRAVEGTANSALNLVGLGSKESATLSEFSAMSKNLRKAAGFAARVGLGVWKTEERLFEEYATQTAKQLEFTGMGAEKFAPALGGKFGKIMRSLSFRAMTTADEFIKSFVGQLEAAAQAHRIAKVEEKLEGDAYAKRITELMEPGSIAWVRAIDEVNTVTFQTPLDGTNPQTLARIDQIAELAKMARNLPWIGKPLTFFIPFIDTPTNIFKEAIKMTPIGIALATIDGARALNRKYNRGELTKAEANLEAGKLYNRARLVEDVTNQTIGIALYFAVASLLEGDEDDDRPFITGTQPYETTRRGERDNAYAVMPEQSIRLGNTTLSYRRWEPFATVLASLVDLARETEANGGEMDASVVSAWIGGHKNQLKDKTFLQGIGSLMDAFEDPDRFLTRISTNIVTGFVPNIVRQPIRTADPMMRDTTPRGEQGFLESVARGVGYSVVPAAAPEKIDVWGNPIRKNRGQLIGGSQVTDSALRILDPVNITVNPDIDPIDRWIFRYNMLTADSKDRIAIQPISDKIAVTLPGEKRQTRISLTAEEQAEANRRAGQAARQMLGNDWDKTPHTEENAKRIIETVRDVQTAERERLRIKKLTETAK